MKPFSYQLFGSYEGLLIVLSAGGGCILGTHAGYFCNPFLG